MKKLIFFIRRAFKDFVDPNRFFVSEKYLTSDDVFPYSLDYSTHGMMDYYKLKFDPNRIIMMSHYIDHDSTETNYYSPVKIAHYALASYNDYLKTNDAKFKAHFERHIKYLVDNYKIHRDIPGMIVWTTPSTNPRYGIEMNYISAIVQGLVLSALSRAFLHFKDDSIKTICENALNVFYLNVEDGGILAKTKWGDLYEEYPCIPYSHVVNGFIFALIGLYDFYLISDSKRAIELYKKGIKALKKLMPDWYLKNWSKYDLRDISSNNPINLCTHHYQCLHADLLKSVYLQTRDEAFNDLYNLTERQLKRKVLLANVYFNKFKSLILSRE